LFTLSIPLYKNAQKGRLLLIPVFDLFHLCLD
jgi:hypothetical protein